jgi:hypothetical protein
VGKINYGRVVIGGIAAAVVFAVTDWVGMQLLGFDWEGWAARFNLTMPPIATMIVTWLLLGILAVWLYAAIRPRFGAGMRTAVIAAVFLWVMFGLIYWGFAAMGMWTMGEYGRMAAWGLVQTLAAVGIGAWLYKEDGGALSV